MEYIKHYSDRVGVQRFCKIPLAGDLFEFAMAVMGVCMILSLAPGLSNGHIGVDAVGQARCILSVRRTVHVSVILIMSCTNYAWATLFGG